MYMWKGSGEGHQYMRIFRETNTPTHKPKHQARITWRPYNNSKAVYTNSLILKTQTSLFAGGICMYMEMLDNPVRPLLLVYIVCVFIWTPMLLSCKCVVVKWDCSLFVDVVFSSTHNPLDLSDWSCLPLVLVWKYRLCNNFLLNISELRFL